MYTCRATAWAAWPVLLIRTPYGREESESLFRFADEYAIVIQDVRGRFDSEGEYRPFLDDGWGDNKDGFDTVAWIRRQTWCNGKIGTAGQSAEGITQHPMAGTTAPRPYLSVHPPSAPRKIHADCFSGRRL